jgi:hypothetical protein
MIRANDDYSALGWIDFSSEHREKVKTVIDLLRVSDVVDELGIGTIRDCLSDTLFPGISTIQTRAKYFVTLPRLLREYQALPPHFRRNHPLADWLNDQENQCMKYLHTNHRTDPQKGIIGVDFAEKPGGGSTQAVFGLLEWFTTLRPGQNEIVADRVLTEVRQPRRTAARPDRRD